MPPAAGREPRFTTPSFPREMRTTTRPATPSFPRRRESRSRYRCLILVPSPEGRGRPPRGGSARDCGACHPKTPSLREGKWGTGTRTMLDSRLRGNDGAGWAGVTVKAKAARRGIPQAAHRGIPPAARRGIPPAARRGIPPAVHRGIPPAVRCGIPPAVRRGIPPAVRRGIPPAVHYVMPQAARCAMP